MVKKAHMKPVNFEVILFRNFRNKGITRTTHISKRRHRDRSKLSQTETQSVKIVLMFKTSA